MLFSEPKFPQCTSKIEIDSALPVSVLFSEPKIPQSYAFYANQFRFVCFSALQRAENSSILQCATNGVHDFKFQCSSASRKFLNRVLVRRIKTRVCVSVLFSEPKIPQYCANISEQKRIARFQCSSASRKILNYEHDKGLATRVLKFQCSSASRKFLNANDSRITRCRSVDVSVLFSEPKIPQ